MAVQPLKLCDGVESDVNDKIFLFVWHAEAAYITIPTQFNRDMPMKPV